MATILGTSSVKMATIWYPYPSKQPQYCALINQNGHTAHLISQNGHHTVPSSVKTTTILGTSSVETATILGTPSVETAPVLCPHQSKWPPYVHFSQNGHYTVFTSTSVERCHSKDILLGDARKEAGLYQQFQWRSSTSKHSLAHSFQGQLLQPMAELLASPQGVVANGVLCGERPQLRWGPQKELHGCRRCCWYGSLKASKGD